MENGETKIILLLINGAVGLWVGFRYKTKEAIATSSFILHYGGGSSLPSNRDLRIYLINWAWVG